MKKIASGFFFLASSLLYAESLVLSTEIFRCSSANAVFSLRVDPPKLTPRQYDYLYMGNYASIYRESPAVKRESLVTWLSLYENNKKGEALLWERPASQVKVAPVDFHITDLGSVVTLGDALGGGHGHSTAFVVYGSTGQVLKSYVLSDILSEGQRLTLMGRPHGVWWKSITSFTEKKSKEWGEPNEELIIISLIDAIELSSSLTRNVSIRIKGDEVKLSLGSDATEADK